MENMISKELLSEVLGVDIEDVYITENQVLYSIPNYEIEEDSETFYINLGTRINIHELSHKCKEWAYEKGYILYSGKEVNEYTCYFEKETGFELSNIDTWLSTFSDTEPEAIFKACQWILDYKDNK